MRVMDARDVELLVEQSAGIVFYVLHLDLFLWMILVLSVKQLRDKLIVNTFPNRRIWNVGIKIFIALIITIECVLFVGGVNEIRLILLLSLRRPGSQIILR